MQKQAMFVKVGNVVFPDYTTQPRVVVSVTKYEFSGMEYFYLEMQELFGEDIVRRGVPGNSNISCLDPEESARLYELHQKGGPSAVQQDPSKLDLADYRKMNTLGATVQKGDIILDRDGIVYGIAEGVERGKEFNTWVIRVRVFRTDAIDTVTVHGTQPVDVMRKKS